MLLLWLSSQFKSQTLPSLELEPLSDQHAKSTVLQNSFRTLHCLESHRSYQHIWILLWSKQQRSPGIEKEVSRAFEFHNKKKPSSRTQLFPDKPAECLHRLQQQHRQPRHLQYSSGSPPPSFQTTYPTASVWSLQMHLSIRKLWIMVYRLCCHYLYIHRVPASNHLGDQVSHGEEEVKGRRSRPYQITADVDPNEQYDGHLFCECSNNSCYGTNLPTDQSESSNPLPRFDEQITANYYQTILER